MPVAVKLVVSPVDAEAVVGLMAIAVNAGAVTVNVALLELTPLAEAVTVVLPTATLVATPVVPLIVAILVLPDAQVTWLVMLAVEAFEYVPVAVKLVVSPLATVAVAGVMAMLVSVTDVGVTLLLPPPPQAATTILKSITKINLVIFNSYHPESNLRLDRFAHSVWHIALLVILMSITLRYELLRIR